MIISGEKGFALALGLLFMATSQSPDYITRAEKVSPTRNLLKSSQQPSVVNNQLAKDTTSEAEPWRTGGYLL
jgi:hypothetical protein